jgi:hypothetical protein
LRLFRVSCEEVFTTEAQVAWFDRLTMSGGKPLTMSGAKPLTMSGGKPLTLSVSKGSAVQSPNLSSPQRHEEHEGKEMTDDRRAPTGRSAVFGRLSTIVNSFPARTEIALARFTTRKPEVLQLNSFLAQPVTARYRRTARVMSTAFFSSVVLAALPIYVSVKPRFDRNTSRGFREKTFEPVRDERRGFGGAFFSDE